MLVQVVAVSENGVIGREGRLPWRLKSEIAHFRHVTMGRPVIMGRKTYVSIGKPLVRRTNIVLSRDPSFAASGVIVTGGLDSALNIARGDALRRGVHEIAIIGGEDIYRQTLAAAGRLVVTRVPLHVEGDARFPAIDPAIWEEVSRTEHSAGPGDETGYTVMLYQRVRSQA
jgi:dihydrofolate reductase